MGLLLLLLLLGGLRYAHAQNTGAAPYLDSWHAYQVKIGKTGNTKYWVVTDKGTPGNTYTLNASNAWFVITPAAADGGNEMVNVFFDRTIFTHTGNWYLQYFEYEDHGGTNVCVSARELPINVTDNDFYLLVSGLGQKCNDLDGEVVSYVDIDTESHNTEVTYTVTMNKQTGYSPNSWQFDAGFVGTVSSFAVAVSTVGGGTATYTENLGVYSVLVSPETGGFPNEVVVTLTLSFSYPVLSVANPSITVSNGLATVDGIPPTPDAITYDNTSIHPVSNPGNRTHAVTINAIPATRDIEPGTGETATSAGNPLQNSTHRYNVTMESYDNNTRAWTIRNSSDVPMAAGTDYTLVPTNSGNVVTAAITFSDAMPAGTYTLYFEETNGTTTCSTIRAYPFTLHGPFDADLASISPICPTASNEIFATNSPSVTEVNYTVTLNNTGYGSAWSFNFNLSSNPAFDVANVTVSGTTVTPATVSYNNGTGLVNVPADVEEVTLTVTYNGIYETAHTITATLTNVTGSFNETDSDTDAISHTIHALPQAGAIAGIE